VFWSFLAIDLFAIINGSPIELNWLPGSKVIRRTEVAYYQEDGEVCPMLKVYLRGTRISRSVWLLEPLFRDWIYSQILASTYSGGIKWLPQLCSSLVYCAVACRFFQPFTSCLALPKLLNNRHLHSIRSYLTIWKRLKWVPYCIFYRSCFSIYSLARRNKFFEWGRQFWLHCAGRRGECFRGMFQSLYQFCINLAIYSICSITSLETLDLLDNSFFASVDLLSL
jgi:hypothetical protein